jgi:hypothetical protein
MQTSKKTEIFLYCVNIIKLILIEMSEPLSKSMSAPIIPPLLRQQRSGSMLKVEQVPLSPRRSHVQETPLSPRAKTEKYFLRDLDGRIAKLVYKKRKDISTTEKFDPYDITLIQEVLKNGSDIYSINWISGIEFQV